MQKFNDWGFTMIGVKDRNKYKGKSRLGKAWYFIWEEDSVLSWVVNIVIAFVLIKFLVYPGLGFALGGTSHPIVAVVSGSMEHDVAFDDWWQKHENFYDKHNISKSEFREYKFDGGFNKGDIMVLYKTKPENIEVGDVLVFRSIRPDPIIHRVVDTWEENGSYYFKTKGDHNSVSIKSFKLDETRIPEDQVIGEAVFRVPFVGWVKIGAVELLARLGLMPGISM